MAFFKYTSISRLYAGKQALIFLMYFSVRSIGIHYGTSTMTRSAATKYTPVEYSWGTHRVIVELVGNSIVRTVLLGQGTVRWGSPDVYMSLALQPFQQNCSGHGGSVPLPLLQARDTATHLQSFLQPAPATGSCHQEQRNASCWRCHQSHLGGGEDESRCSANSFYMPEPQEQRGLPGLCTFLTTQDRAVSVVTQKQQAGHTYPEILT